MQVMKDSDLGLLYSYYRMSPETFDSLHGLVGERLTMERLCREPLSSGERLALTLRYLSSGMRIPDVAMAFRVGKETARQAIHLTCLVLWEELSPIYMKLHSSTYGACFLGTGGGTVVECRRCVENAFGILASRWSIYDRRINLELENAENVVKATCVLHNFLCISKGAAAHNCPPGYADVEDTFGNVREGAWRAERGGGAAMFELQGAKA
ncbi:hypothetical protein HPB48_014940 [Haemaphysalis longicornis]|uniref:DDE Tnp4 domain-containing protein n=1 Tax=Haemaphysalis longicornis TaxID=44386 RepID=A0A9J6FI27_HAELO|nr:hypothetical protein HPB48_014940 [Haemaphysalis longicornis]